MKAGGEGGETNNASDVNEYEDEEAYLGRSYELPGHCFHTAVISPRLAINSN